MSDPPFWSDKASGASKEVLEALDAIRPPPLPPEVQARVAAHLAAVAGVTVGATSAIVAGTKSGMFSLAMVGGGIGIAGVLAIAIASQTASPRSTTSAGHDFQTAPSAKTGVNSAADRAPQEAPSVVSAVALPHDARPALVGGTGESSIDGTTIGRTPAAARGPSVAPHAHRLPLPEAALPREEQLLERGRGAVESAPQVALAITRQHAREFPGSRLAQEREFIALRALVRLGRTAEVRARGQAFVRRYPQGLFVDAVQRLPGM